MSIGLGNIASTLGGGGAGLMAGGGATGGLAAGGMAFPPLLLASLFSMAPGLLSHLFGGDPQKDLRNKLMGLLNPQNQANQTNQFYQQNLGSPAFSQGMSNIAAGANATEGKLGQSLGARGIGTTGTGAILSSLTPSIVGSQQAGLKTQAFQSAQQQQQDTLRQQIAALTGTSGPSQTQQYFAGGLQALGPLLEGWLRQRYPGSFAPQGQ